MGDDHQGGEVHDEWTAGILVNNVLGYDHMPQAYMEAQGKREASVGVLTTVTGLTLVFAIQYLIDYESDVFKNSEGGLKAYLFFMSTSAGVSGLGLWICVAFMAFNANLQAEYMESGMISAAQFKKYKEFIDNTFVFRLAACGCTCTALLAMVIGTFIYVGYKLDAADLDWNYIAIPVVLASFFTLLALIVSVLVLCCFCSATGYDQDGNQRTDVITTGAPKY